MNVAVGAYVREDDAHGSVSGSFGSGGFSYEINAWAGRFQIGLTCGWYSAFVISGERMQIRFASSMLRRVMAGVAVMASIAMPAVLTAQGPYKVLDKWKLGG